MARSLAISQSTRCVWSSNLRRSRRRATRLARSASSPSNFLSVSSTTCRRGIESWQIIIIFFSYSVHIFHVQVTFPYLSLTHEANSHAKNVQKAAMTQCEYKCSIRCDPWMTTSVITRRLALLATLKRYISRWFHVSGRGYLASNYPTPWARSCMWNWKTGHLN